MERRYIFQILFASICEQFNSLIDAPNVLINYTHAPCAMLMTYVIEHVLMVMSVVIKLWGLKNDMAMAILTYIV